MRAKVAGCGKPPRSRRARGSGSKPLVKCVSLPDALEDERQAAADLDRAGAVKLRQTGGVHRRLPFHP